LGDKLVARKQQHIASSEDFYRVSDALASDLTSAAIHYQLYKDLRSNVPEFQQEFNASRTFWWMTLRAHLQYALTCLTRVYDQEPSALSLRKWLELIDATFDLLKNSCFMEPVESKPFRLATGEVSRLPDRRRLEMDMHYASNRNSLVGKLTVQRNNLLAHRSMVHALRGGKALDKLPLSFTAVEELLNGAFEIFNTYSQVFRNATHSRPIIGGDDFRFVLGAIRDQLERRSHALDREDSSE
jgi:hypothetical protein